MTRGSCLCRAVRYELQGEIEEFHHCHCSRCRKAHGAAFASYACVSRAGLELHGAEELRTVPGAGATRQFCGRCGSPLLFALREWPELVWLAAGSFDDDPIARPSSHLHVGSRAVWYEIHDALVQHVGAVALDQDAASGSASSVDSSAAAVVRGSLR